jgi:uncharacterized protein
LSLDDACVRVMEDDLTASGGATTSIVESRRVLAIAILGEGLLALIAIAWAWHSDIPLRSGRIVSGLAAGIACASGLALVQYWFLRRAPDRGPIRALRQLYRTTLRPLFGRLTPVEIAVISLFAGVCEELLFRGVVQAEWGWAAASLLFGLCHVGGRATWALGIWAAGTGALLGWLAIATEGLLAPVVAHAVYDALALSYIRWGPPV